MQLSAQIRQKKPRYKLSILILYSIRLKLFQICYHSYVVSKYQSNKRVTLVNIHTLAHYEHYDGSDGLLELLKLPRVDRMAGD